MSLFKGVEQNTNSQKKARKLQKLSETFYIIETIKQEWDANGWNERNWTVDTITRKFRKMLEDLGFKDEIKWYYSESGKGGSGKLIFNGENTPWQMRELFNIFYDNNGLLLTEEKNRIAKILVNILPMERSLEGQKRLKESFEKLDKTSERKEKRMLEEYLFDTVIDKIQKHEVRIWEIVNAFNPNKTDVFLCRLFVRVEKAEISLKSGRQKFYRFQYFRIREWLDKWKLIMEDAVAVRIAERFENGYLACIKHKVTKEERRAFYENGDVRSQALQDVCGDSNWIRADDLCEALSEIYEKDSSNGQENGEGNIQDAESSKNNEKKWEDWRDECLKLVNDLLSNELKNVSKEDFEYMINCAFQELEIIRLKVLREKNKNIYSSETRGRTEKDLDKLSQIKEAIATPKRTILDRAIIY